MSTAVHTRRLRLGLTATGWAWLVFAAVWLATGWLVWHRATPPGSDLDFHSFSHVDFRDSVWIAVHDFLHGGVPWDPDAFTRRHPEAQFFPIYLPSYFYLAAPLVLLPYRLLATLWVGLEVATLVWMVHRSLTVWAPRAMARTPWLVAATSIALLATRPVQTSISQGNWAMLCAAGTLLALTGRRRWRTTSSRHAGITDPAVWGVVVALVKPPVGLALLLVLLCTRRGAVALWGLVVTVLLGLPVVGVVLHRMGGLAPTIDLLGRSLDAGDGATPGYAHYTRIDVSATLGRLVDNPPAVVLVAVFAAVTLLCVTALVDADRRFGHLDARTIALAGLTIVVLTPNLHYAMIALVPATVALAARLARCWDGWALVALALLLVPLVSPVRGSAVLGVTPQAANLGYGLCLVAGLVVVAVWVRLTSSVPRRAEVVTAA